jgi:hypothetical protein
VFATNCGGENASGGPELLAESFGPRDIRVNRSEVCWISDRSPWDSAVKCRPLAGGEQRTISVLRFSGEAAPFFLTIDDGAAYWIQPELTPRSFQVMKAPLGGGEPEELARTDDFCGGLEQVGDFIYWMGGNGFFRVHKSGGPTVVLAMFDKPGTWFVTHGPNAFFKQAGWVTTIALEGGPPRQIAQLEASPLAADDHHVYGSVHANRAGEDSVVAIPLTTGGPRTVATGQTNPFGLASDGKHLYWAERFAGKLWKVPVGGGDAASVVATSPSAPSDIALDERYLYWGDLSSNQVYRIRR